MFAKYFPKEYSYSAIACFHGNKQHNGVTRGKHADTASSRDVLPHQGETNFVIREERTWSPGEHTASSEKVLVTRKFTSSSGNVTLHVMYFDIRKRTSSSGSILISSGNVLRHQGTYFVIRGVKCVIRRNRCASASFHKKAACRYASPGGIHCATGCSGHPTKPSEAPAGSDSRLNARGVTGPRRAGNKEPLPSLCVALKSWGMRDGGMSESGAAYPRRRRAASPLAQFSVSDAYIPAVAGMTNVESMGEATAERNLSGTGCKPCQCCIFVPFSMIQQDGDVILLLCMCHSSRLANNANPACVT